jgi:hypothetical protein
MRPIAPVYHPIIAKYWTVRENKGTLSATLHSVDASGIAKRR